MNGTIVGTGPDAVDRLGVGAQTWVYHSPADSSTAKYRLTDFNGYKHKGYEYRGPVRFRPVHEYVFPHSVNDPVESFGTFETGGHISQHITINNYHTLKTYGRQPQNTTKRT